MSLRQKYLNVVSKLLTPSALGMAVVLGSAAPGAASQGPVDQSRTGAQSERVSERLAAIREAVSAVAGTQGEAGGAAGGERLAWGNWHNGGFGGGGFGFGLGSPWGNIGIGVPWNNWNNWRNGWHNWGNGWGNW